MTTKQERPKYQAQYASKTDIKKLAVKMAAFEETAAISNEISSQTANEKDFVLNIDCAKEKDRQIMNERTIYNFRETHVKNENPEELKRAIKHEIGSHRFHVALLGLTIAAVNCYAQATFCIAIVEMVLPADFLVKSETGQSVVRVMTAANGVASTSATSVFQVTDPVALEDHSCPVEYKYRAYYDSWRFLPSENSSTTLVDQQAPTQTNTNLIDVSDRFDWDASRQGLLLGAFAMGTAPLQVLGGRLAEIYGAKWVLLAGCIGTALTNLTIPLIARFSFVLLLINRVMMGIAQAGMEPGLMCLLAEWLTPAETGFFISMLLFALCIGFFLGSLCSSFILTIGYGWSLTYYVAGGLNLIVGIVWFLYASSRPDESKLISVEELAYIENSKQLSTRKITLDENSDLKLRINNDNNNCYSISTPLSPLNGPISKGEQRGNLNNIACQTVPVDEAEQAPWMNILRTRSVWAFIICKVCIRWAADVVGIELPSYLANVLHLSIKLNGILNSISSALFAIFSFLTGYFVNEILKNQMKQSQLEEQFGVDRTYFKISKTNLRKLIQSGASFGSAICMCLMTRYDCNILFSMSMLLVLSCCLVMGTGGELQIPYDMTSKYPGTVHGLACTMSVSGWLAPPLIGLILGDQPSNRYRWNIVWYLTASINLIGGLVFVLFADASPRDFDKIRIANSNKKRTLNSAKDKRGRHNDDDLDGYYNEACKSSANTSPVSFDRRLRHNGSPSMPVNLLKTDNSLNDSNGQQPLNWSSHFDRDLIKCRQVEESFIVKPAHGYTGYLHNHLDSLATQPIIFPYRAKQTKSEQQQLQRHSIEQEFYNSTSSKTDAHQQRGFIWRLSSLVGGQSRKKFSFEANRTTKASPTGAGWRINEPEAELVKSKLANSRADVLPHEQRERDDTLAGNERDSNQQLAAEAAFGGNATSGVAATMTTTKTITHL